MKALLEAKDIQRLLLHRYPILYVDRILDIIKDKCVIGVKNFTVNEPFLQGHFPGNPIVPGTVLIEAMAQVGAIFVSQSEPDSKHKLIYLVGLDGVRFRQPVLPGDQVVFELSLLKRKQDIWKVKGTATVEEKLVMEAILLAAVR